MDGENNGSKPYFLMDDLGVSPYFWVDTQMVNVGTYTIHGCCRFMCVLATWVKQQMMIGQ